MKAITFSAAFFLLISCNSQQEEKNSNEKTDQQQTETCYLYINNNDTVTLSTVQEGKTVTGDLAYNLYEKDKNTGTIRGEMKGDLLIADYTFMSEGMKSTAQVVFKKTGNTLVQGYGEVVNQGSSVTFKNIDSLNYTNSILLKETNCEK